MLNRLLKVISAIAVIAAMALAIAPQTIAAADGPSITIGDPTCANAGLHIFPWPPVYVYYDPLDDTCVRETYFPAAKTTFAPSRSATDANLPGLKPIEFPTFIDTSTINSFSVWSYVAVIVTLLFTVLIIFWVVLIARAGIDVITSSGDPAALQKAQKRISNVFIGIVFLVGFFVVVNIVAAVIGIGNFSEWPKKLSVCRDGETYYYNLQLQNPSFTEQQIDANCFGMSS